MSLFSSFKQFIQKKNLITPHDHLVVAVSGGIDSIVLLDLLHRLQSFLPLRLVVAHLNHNVRGKASLADARFVAKEAKKRNLPFELQTLPKGILKKGGNFQEEARKKRYSFLVSIAKKYKATRIVTAHQADDQAETFLMRLMRGAGAQGLKGMQFQSELPFLQKEKTKIGLMKPLLSFSRAEILAYAKEKKLTWREDASNARQDYLRNRIRHCLLKEMKILNPQVVHHLSDALMVLSDENDWLEDLLSQRIKKYFTPIPCGLAVDLTWLCKQSSPLRYRIYRHALKETKLGLLGIHRSHWDAIDQMVICQNKHTRITLPRGFVTHLDQKKWVVKKGKNTQLRSKQGFFY